MVAEEIEEIFCIYNGQTNATIFISFQPRSFCCEQVVNRTNTNGVRKLADISEKARIKGTHDSVGLTGHVRRQEDDFLTMI